MPRAPRIAVPESDDELVTLLANPPKAVCTVASMIADHVNGAEIQAAVDNPKWSAAQLAPVLSRKVRPISTGAITAHRNQTCRCER